MSVLVCGNDFEVLHSGSLEAVEHIEDDTERRALVGMDEEWVLVTEALNRLPKPCLDLLRRHPLSVDCVSVAAIDRRDVDDDRCAGTRRSERSDNENEE